MTVKIVDAEMNTPINQHFIEAPTSAHMRSPHTRVSKLNSKASIEIIKSLTAKSLEIHYAGYGDSGQVESCIFKDTDGNEIETMKSQKADIKVYSLTSDTFDPNVTDIPNDLFKECVTICVKFPNPRPKDWSYPSFTQSEELQNFLNDKLDTDAYNATVRLHKVTEAYYSKTLGEIAEDLAYDIIQQYHAGYENNDGGSGNITYDIENNKFRYEMHDYYQSTETTEVEFEGA